MLFYIIGEDWYNTVLCQELNLTRKEENMPWRDWISAAEMYKRGRCVYYPQADNRVVKTFDGLPRAAQDLDAFLKSSEGRAAMELLSASGIRIDFSRQSIGDGLGVVCFIDGTGLYCSTEEIKTWVAHGRPHSLEIEDISANEAIAAAMNPGICGKKPEDVMSCLRNELDSIASAVFGRHRGLT
jgi:hypothetical protein